MNDQHWYPRNPVAFLTDTQWCDYATEVAHGRLIDTYYALGKPIKDEQSRIQNIGKIKDADYHRVRGNLFELGWRIEDGVWRHKRVEETMLEMQEKSEARRRQTDAATRVRQAQAHVDGNVTKDVTTNVTKVVTSAVKPPSTKTQLQLQSQLQSESQKQSNDKASPQSPSSVSPIKPTKPKKLSELQKEIADNLEQALGDEWTNDAGKWIGRIKTETNKAERVTAEVQNAIKESRIDTTPAAYAEDIWKRFK